MDNMITGALAALLFIAFTVGLAQSIGTMPFIIIVGIVVVMMLIDLVQSIREGFSEERRKK